MANTKQQLAASVRIHAYSQYFDKINNNNASSGFVFGLYELKVETSIADGKTNINFTNGDVMSWLGGGSIGGGAGDLTDGRTTSTLQSGLTESFVIIEGTSTVNLADLKQASDVIQDTSAGNAFAFGGYEVLLSGAIQKDTDDYFIDISNEEGAYGTTGNDLNDLTGVATFSSSNPGEKIADFDGFIHRG